MTNLQVQQTNNVVDTLFDSKEMASALIAAGGDIKLVVERINISNKMVNPQAREISDRDVLEAFLSEATTNLETQNSIKALILLNFLQILSASKDHLVATISDFNSHEIISTIKLVVEGLRDLLPPPPQENNGGTTVNLLQQFGADQARDRVLNRLDQYRKVEEQYGKDPS